MRTAALLVLLFAVAACGSEAEQPRETEQPPDAVPGWYRASDCEVVDESRDGRLLRCFRGGRPTDHGVFVREDAAGRRLIPVEAPRNPDSSKKQVVIGHWRWAALSPDGTTLLAEWSAECEVPIAYYVPVTGGVPRRVTAGTPDLVESRALGWTTDGRAIVHFPRGPGCGPLSEQPGVYLLGADGEARLIRTDEALERSLAPRLAASLVARDTVGYY